MKRVLLFVVAALVLSARPAFGGIDLTWNACNVDGGVTNLTFDCGTPGTTHRLLGCFQAPKDIGIVYLESVLDIQFEALTDPPQFWDPFDAGGCNGSGFTVTAVDPIASCPTVTNPWGTDVTVMLEPVSSGTISGRTRLRITVFRTDGSTFPLVTGHNTFGFELGVSMANGSTCAGCDARGVIAWNWARAVGQGGESADVATTGSGGLCVTFNGGSASTCDVVPARRSTWGAIKSLYR